MVSPSFQIGQQVGNNFGKAFEQVNDQNTIDRIISDALETGDPEAFQDSMGKILSQVSPQNQGNAIKFLEMKTKSIAEKKTLQRKQQAYGKLGLDPDLDPAINAQLLKGQQRQQEIDETYGPKNPVGNQNTQPSQGMNQKNQPNPDQNTPINQPNLGENTPINQPNQQQNRFDLSNVSDADLRARTGSSNLMISKPAKEELDRRKLDVKESGLDRRAKEQNRITVHKLSEKQDAEIEKLARTGAKALETVKDIDKAISTGNVKPTNFANLVKPFGKVGGILSNIFLNPDQATVNASIPQLLDGWKEVFGVRLSDADLKILEDKLPSIGKSPEANKAILKIISKYANANILRNKIAMEIKDKYEGYRPVDFITQVNRRYDEMTEIVEMVDEAGNLLEIPAYRVSAAMKKGAKLRPKENIVNE